MSGLVMSSLPLLCADLRFGLSRISLLPQSPIRRSCYSFWTSSCLPSASKSNPPFFLAPFGLPRISPPPQSPIHRSFSLLLDFLTSPLRFKVQSAALSRPFWTSSCLPSILKSNLPLFLAPFGLPRISPPPQSPIHRSCSPHHAKKGGLQRNPPILIHQSQSANLIPAIPINQPKPPSANSTK